MSRDVKSHAEVARRYFLGLGAAGAAAWSASPLAAGDPRTDALLAEAIARLEYLTPLDRIKPGGRGNPPPSKLPPEKLREAGLHPDTWFLEVTPDPESNVKLERPLSRELGTALDWKALMGLAAKHAVRYRRWKAGTWEPAVTVATETDAVNQLAAPVQCPPDYVALFWDQRWTSARDKSWVRFVRIPNR